MVRIGRLRPSPSTVVAIAALVFALGAGAWAGTKIATKDIKKGAVTTPKIRNGAVTTQKIQDSEPYREIGAPDQPEFQNGWGNFSPAYASVAFYKDPLGVVHLRGTVGSGGMGTTAFTLPSGYRPSANLFMPAAVGTTEGTLNILSTGEVKPSSTYAVGLDGLTFRAEQ